MAGANGARAGTAAYYAARGYQAYSLAGDAIGVGQSAWGIAHGNFSLLDLVGFAPTIGWASQGMSGLRALGDLGSRNLLDVRLGYPAGTFSGTTLFSNPLPAPYFRNSTSVGSTAKYAAGYDQAFGSYSGKTGPIKVGETTTYQDFVNRSVVGDKLEGHELWQHANLKANGLATERLSTAVSQNNLVIALNRATHVQVNIAQRALDAANMTPLSNIRANAAILHRLGAVSGNAITKAEIAAIQYAKSLGYTK